MFGQEEHVEFQENIIKHATECLSLIITVHVRRIGGTLGAPEYTLILKIKTILRWKH